MPISAEILRQDTPVPIEVFIPKPKQPLVVCCGLGRDSIAMLVGMWRRGIRPDAILFADTGSERQSTYDYIAVLNAWLRKVGFPGLTIVVNKVGNFKNWPEYFTLFENLLTNTTLPSIAYGFHTCSAKWKIVPQNKYLAAWEPAQKAWKFGLKVRKAIGFDASPHELKRARGCSTYAVQEDELDKYDLWYPLQEWGWDLAECIRQIVAAGLPIPTKSSCFFCTAMKPWEVEELSRTEPDKLKYLVIIEARAVQRNLDYAERRFKEMQSWLIDPASLPAEHKIHKRTRKAVQKDLCRMAINPTGPVEGWKWNRKPLTEGLWRKSTKGIRGGIAKPGSMTEYIRSSGFLPEAEVDRLIRHTPTHDIKKGEINSWKDWLERLICS